MKYLEVARKINLTKEVSEQEVKQALLDRLQRGFEISNLVETDKGFNVRAKTGGKGNIVRHAVSEISVSVTKDADIVRIIAHGNSKVALSLAVSYTFFLFFMLVLGLVPGSIETSAESSGALDVLVFLIFGIFTFYDIDKKLHEPNEGLQTALESLDTEFG